MRILAINGGSSSFKCRLDDLSADPPSQPLPPLWQKHVERGESIEKILDSVPRPVDVVGHRIAHGGKFRDCTRITAEIRDAIAGEAEIAPEHNRYELDAIQAVERVFGVPQIAVFDAAFHASLDRAAYVYPGPYEWFEQGIRRYGFHGISHQYASRRAAEILGRTLRVVTCHLGNGASLAAVRDGRSVDTTMGFTPLEGLMMGTRSGSIDPGILVYLIRHRGYTAPQLDRILNRESGLAGISGVSGDMREVLAAMDQGNDRARLAFEIYAHRLCRGIGEMIGALGGVDAIVFTGGVGENCAPLREIVTRRFAFLGDLPVLVVHAEEEWEIVRECFRISQNR
jgi:acetate kinase